MTTRIRIRLIMSVILVLICNGSWAQTSSVGIHYQAVARDDFGKELSEKEIDVRFSIISDNPEGPVEYEELHAKVRTSKYGIFSLVIGKGDQVNGTAAGFSNIAWEQSNHYLKVEVKFSADYVDMGTMQFLAVPYALYARKSLEPGPQGPKGDLGPQGLKGDLGAKGDPGNPATDDQTLSFNGNNLGISGGNTVNLSVFNQYLSLKGDTLGITNGNTVMLTNQIQDLQLDINNKLKITKNALASEIDLSPFKQNLSLNSTTGFLSISNGTGVDLTPIKNDAIQDIKLTGNLLTIDKNPVSTGVDLSKYLDDKDNQTLTYDPATYNLSITNGGSVTLGGIIAFRAKKPASDTGLSFLTDYDFIAGSVSYNDGAGYDPGSGVFTAPVEGIYTFNLGFSATGIGDSRVLKLYLNGAVYEIVNTGISGGLSFTHAVTMKLITGDKVKVIINTGTSTESGIGSFSGFRVY